MATRNALIPMFHGVNIDRNPPTKAVRSLTSLRIECPAETAVVSRPSYTFRLAAAPGAGGVEVSIDRGDWMSCREALGLWWCDWSDYAIGDHEVAARMTMGDGIWVIAAPRLFSVEANFQDAMLRGEQNGVGSGISRATPTWQT